MNVADVFPPATVTVAGTEAKPLPLFSEIVTPLDGAAVPSLTVPVEVFPPATFVGLSVSDEITGGSIARVALRVVPFNVADIVAAVCEATDRVLTVNVAWLAPAGIVTVEGTVAADWLLERPTLSPPAGDGPDMVAVPVDEVNPTTEAGLSVT